MDITKKMDMFLINEAAAGAKLTPYAKSAVRLQDVWTDEELNDVVLAISKHTMGSKYEITFAGKGKGKSLMIYRRGDDVLKRNMDKGAIDAFNKEIDAVVKPAGFKVTDNGKNGDWIAAIITQK